MSCCHITQYLLPYYTLTKRIIFRNRAANFPSSDTQNKSEGDTGNVPAERRKRKPSNLKLIIKMHNLNFSNNYAHFFCHLHSSRESLHVSVTLYLHAKRGTRVTPRGGWVNNERASFKWEKTPSIHTVYSRVNIILIIKLSAGSSVKTAWALCYVTLKLLSMLSVVVVFFGSQFSRQAAATFQSKFFFSSLYSSL